MISQREVTSVTDTEIEALVRCAKRRLVVIVPGMSESVAKAIVKTWRDLGPKAVQVAIDPDPEVCRLGLGEVRALKLLYHAAEQMGAQIYQQRGLRLGVIVTDQSTLVYSPTPLLIEAGGQSGEKSNAIRFDLPAQAGESTFNSELTAISLPTDPVTIADVNRTCEDLSKNPPMAFDLARRVRVFNSRIEFVEFELRGLSISRKRVQVPSDLLGLAQDPQAQRLLRSSFQLIGESDELSGEGVNKLKQFIAKKYLIPLPGYGTVILRSNKKDSEIAVKSLERYVHRFQKRLKTKLKAAIEANRELLVSALLPSVARKPPTRWKRYLGEHPTVKEVECLLRNELVGKFGSLEDLFSEMKVKSVFKGVTYESLTDSKFISIAVKAIPSLETLHDEFDAAKAQGPKE